MANSRYDRLDNSSPAIQTLKAPEKKLPRSVFDLSHIVSGQALFGALIPVLCEETVPGQEFDINIFSQISFRNPSIRPLLNGCKVQFHCFYNDVTDLWEGAKNYYDTGRSGKLNLSKPSIILSAQNPDDSDKIYCCTPLSLADYFGIPIQALPKGNSVPPIWQFGGISDGNSPDDMIFPNRSPDFVNALPFMAYQRNWRDYFSNKNLLQNNDFWFPDNEDHFILSYNCNKACIISYENEDFELEKRNHLDNPDFVAQKEYKLLSESLNSKNSSGVYVTSEQCSPTGDVYNGDVPDIYAPVLSAIKFRQFRGDRFTTASPFPDFIRGDEPTLGALDDWVHYVAKDGSFNLAVNGDNASTFFDLVGSPNPNSSSIALGLNNAPGMGKFSGLKTTIGSRITSADINAMNIITAFKTKMGMTNGDYNEMIKSQFGYSPNVHDRKGTYIGGFTSIIDFSSVSQTSESTTNSPLGTKSGQCFSNGQGRIGHFRAPNFGYISVYMSIIPDTYYSQGIPKMFSKQYQKQEYFPILNGLAPDAILNKELFISGDTSVDNDVFAYCEKFEEFKSRRNRVCNFSSLNHDVALFDSALVMKRHFDKTPSFNHRFLTMTPENLDMDVFYFNNEPPFDFSVGFDLTTVAPIPYKSIPKTAEA